MSSELNSTRVIMYGHSTCPGVPPAKAMLRQANVPFDYINIRQDETAAQRVREINNGYESVPTLVFADGTTLTEPSAGQLRKKLQEMGYEVGIWGLIVGNMWNIIFLGIILFAALRFFEVF